MQTTNLVVGVEDSCEQHSRGGQTVTT